MGLHALEKFTVRNASKAALILNTLKEMDFLSLKDYPFRMVANLLFTEDHFGYPSDNVSIVVWRLYENCY